MAKTCYHSELSKLSPVTVQVASDPKKSKFPNKPNYVYLKIQDKETGAFGEERPHDFENAKCEAFFVGQKGRTFTIVAEGREDTATITYVGESGAAIQPPAPKPAHSAPPAARPPAAAPAPHATGAPPPAAPKMTRDEALRQTKLFIGQRLSLLKVCIKAVATLQPEYKSMMKVDMSEETFRAWTTSLYISGESQGLAMRSGFADALPPNIALATLMPPATKPATQQSAPPPPPPVNQPEPAEKEDDTEIPF
jgi:hypothetical protein